MRTHALRITALLVSAAFAQQTYASGYHFTTQSSSAQSVANASGAEANDASTIFTNPAGLSRLDGDNFTGVLEVIAPHGDFTDQGTHTTNFNGSVPGYNGVSPGGDNGGGFVKTTAVPHLYLSHQINDALTVGFGAFVPFGSDVKYNSSWVGRYDVIETSLATVALNPSFSWKVNKEWSIGGGVTAQYINGKLVKGADMGSGAVGNFLSSYGAQIQAGAMQAAAGAQQAGAAAQQAAAAAAAAQAAGNAAAAQQYAAQAAQYGAQAKALAAQAQSLAAIPGTLISTFAGQSAFDGQVSVKGDDWGYGFNVGALYNADDHTRFGIAYRSQIHHKLSGNATWTVSQNYANNSVLAQTGAALGLGNTLGGIVQSTLNGQFTNSAASIAVDTPESFSINGYHDFTDRFALMADITWTKHSRFQALTVRFANQLPPANIPENWADTTKYSLGASYRLSDALQLRAGWSYDQSPVTDANRTPALPDGNRRWYSFGANWKLS
ncbi:MAG: transporter, partial [Burkholderiales bacterium]|nr:transporter [Burkholderiales bacterium]